MNRAVLQCLNVGAAPGGGGGVDMSVLERQHARIKYWQQEEHHHHHHHHQQQQQLSLFAGDELSMLAGGAHQFHGLVNESPGFVEFVSRAMKPEPGLEGGWPELGKFGGGDGCVDPSGIGFGSGSGSGMEYGVSRTVSCPTVVAAAAAMAEMAAVDTTGNLNLAPKKLNNKTAARESFKKRKADKTLNTEAAEDETKEKKIRGCVEEGHPKIKEEANKNKSTTNNDNKSKKQTSGDASRDNSKVSEVEQKPDYIHVRARRGQATDSHSLAERVRREKISERMKYLQDLVPGCNKITGKAGMLDEIINYVQSLQRQVEFLSMKLAAVNPRLDFNIDNLFNKEIFPACTSSSLRAVGATADMTNPPCPQFNTSQEAVSCCRLDMGLNPPDTALRRTISAPTSMPETFLDASGFNQIQTSSSAWDNDLQNIYSMEFHQQDRLTSFPSQPFTGLLKQESYQDFDQTII